MNFWNRLFGPRCAACGKTLKKSSSGLFIGRGEEYAERIKSRPTYCSACGKYFCLDCAFKASRAKKVNFHCCPECGGEVPDYYPL